jgi:hypothetical protein
MFKIDLLKGQGVPVKSRPESIAITAVALVVPIVIAFVMLGYFLQNRKFRRCGWSTAGI